MRSGKSNTALVGPRMRSDLETYNNVEAISALYANLASAFFAMIYAKSLIPRLGT